ncbi:MAG TPA: DUF4157 domain-containing protein [Chthoniobacterales bacterium]
MHDVLRSPGQPLNSETRALMEPRFGHDFSQVRIHTDTRAAESAEAVNALAYTVGQDVVFRNGAYRPQTSSGQTLLAHELVHTIQQTPAQLSSTENLTVGEITAPAEVEAENCARRFTEGAPISSSELRSKSAAQIQRAGFGDVRVAEARQAEEERIQAGCPVKSEGTLSEVSWGETAGLYPSKDNLYDPSKWDGAKKCELLRLRGALHAVGQRGESVHRGRPGSGAVEQKLKPYHFIENFLSLDPEIAKAEVRFFYLSKHAALNTHPTMGTLIWVKKYGPFFNVGGGDVPKGDVYVHFYKGGA